MNDLLISWLLARLLGQSFRRDAIHTASVYPCRSLYPPLSCRALASKLTCAIMEMFATLSMRTTSRRHWCAKGCVLVDSARSALPRVPHQGAAGNLFCPFLVRRSLLLLSSAMKLQRGYRWRRCFTTARPMAKDDTPDQCASYLQYANVRNV